MSDTKNRSLLSLNREARQGVAIEERLHKVLANAGLGSRRLLEERIAAGEVKVNATMAETGSSVRSGDRVEIDGKAFITVATEPDEGGVLIYHKPEGEVTTNDDPEGRPTVFERLPHLKGARWVSVGRLDINTTGLLLLTTDGELANALMHPSSEIEREYVCRIFGNVDGDMIERLKLGVELEDGPAKFDNVAVISIGESHSWLRVTLHEGRNREVRRIWESQGVQVSRLKRIRYGSIELPRQLRRGHYEELPLATWREIRSSMGLPPVPMTLTLQPVIGVRRAQKTQNEFRPGARNKSDSWSGAHHDEARELRAFDFVREDKAAPGNARRRRGKKNRRGPGPGAGAGAGAGANGNAGGMRQPPWRQNPAEIRSWNAGAPGEGRPGKRRSGKKRGGPGGQRGAPMVTNFPSDHAYANRGNEAGRGPGSHARGPGGGPGRGPRPGGGPGRGPRADGGPGRGPHPGGGGPGRGPHPGAPQGPGAPRRRGRHRPRAPH